MSWPARSMPMGRGSPGRWSPQTSLPWLRAWWRANSSDTPGVPSLALWQIGRDSLNWPTGARSSSTRLGRPPADVQVKLLRVLETGGVTRVGEATPQIVNVRVIAATNRNLAQGVQAGTFREDLYHRLRVFPITMPALSERPGDIEPLAQHFLARSIRGPLQPASSQVMSAEFLAALRDRDWPGNVRELKHAIEYAAVVARRGKLRPEHLPAPDRPGTSGTAAGIESAARAVAAAVKEWSAAARRELAALPEPDLHHRAIQLVEGTLLREALAHTGGNRTAAARLLGLDRATLRTKLRSLGIDD